jgi:hypothetical protein
MWVYGRIEGVLSLLGGGTGRLFVHLVQGALRLVAAGPGDVGISLGIYAVRFEKVHFELPGSADAFTPFCKSA